MKAVVVHLIFGFACTPLVSSLCRVSEGRTLDYFFQREYAKLDFPCKYNFIRQTCGSYTIRITPGNIYKHPHYFINTVWINVDNGTHFWQGRTDNKITVKYINGNISEPFNQKGGNMTTSDLFKFTRFKADLYGFANYTDYGYFYARARDDQFQVYFRPYLVDSFMDQGVYFSFDCFKPNDPPNFPQQLCGGKYSCQISVEAYKLGFAVKGRVNDLAREKAIFYYVFTDNTTDQTPEPRCADVVDAMLNVCANKTQRADAINRCYRILRSRPHRTCVTKYSCDPIDVFYECVRFVCSSFTDGVACQALGEYIDMCPEIPGLTDEVKECYKDNLISFAQLNGVKT